LTAAVDFQKRRELMSRYLDPKADVVFKKIFGEHPNLLIDEKTTSVSKDLLAIPEIAQAVALSEESAYTPGELTLYESYWDQISREKTLIMDKYAEGKAEGKAEIAMNMLKDNEPLDRISRFTGLSQDEIMKLKLIE
jgi:hypothetical protein